MLQSLISFDHDFLKLEEVIADEQLLEQPFVLGLESLRNEVQQLFLSKPDLFHDGIE